MLHSKTTLYILTTAIICIASITGLMTPSIEGLDSSHNVMDGFYFYDLFTTDIFQFQHPKEIIQYTLDYHAQYPALGFIYWLPFWPLIESLFFIIFGPSLLSAQCAVTLFTSIFGFSFIAVITRLVSPKLALAGLIAIFATSEIWVSANTIMRDMPALAMMMLTFWSIIRWHESHFHNSWLFTSVFIAAIGVYTKQTTAIMPISIFITLLFTNPRQLKTKASIIGAILFILLITPAIAFTLTLGSQNLGQSFGNSTSTIMQNYEGISRLSIENWTYYLEWTWQATSMMSLMSLFGLFYITQWLRKTHATNRFILIGLIFWIVTFYLFFSYFDNKAHRFGTLYLPPIFIIAILTIETFTKKFMSISCQISQKKTASQNTDTNQTIARLFQNCRFLNILNINNPNNTTTVLSVFMILIFTLPNAIRTYNEGIPRISHIDNTIHNILATTKNTSQSSCIAYIGNFKQAFTQSLRRLDQDRLYHLIPITQDAILAPNNTHQCDTIIIEASIIEANTIKDIRSTIEHTLEQHGYNQTFSYFNSPKLKRSLLIFQKTDQS